MARFEFSWRCYWCTSETWFVSCLSFAFNTCFWLISETWIIPCFNFPSKSFVSILKYDIFPLVKDPLANVVGWPSKHGPQSLKLGVLQSEHGFVHLKHGPFSWEYCSLVEGVAMALVLRLNYLKMFQRSHHDVELGPFVVFAPSNQFHQFDQYLDDVVGLPNVLVGSQMDLTKLLSLMHLLMIIKLEIKMHTLLWQLCQ